MFSKKRYPWNRWFSRPTVLVAGVDYYITNEMMHQTVRNNASLRGFLVSLRDTESGDGIHVEITGVRCGIPHPYKTSVPA